MNATLISAAEKSNGVYAHAYTAAEAAEMLGVSEATVRRTAKRLNVRLGNRFIAGFVAFSRDSLPPVTLAYVA